MALYKEIRQQNGVRLNYHRVLYLQKMINNHNTIALTSYADEEARLCENDGFENMPYNVTTTYYMDYDPDMTVEQAYEYIKSLPEFIGAQDV